MCACVCVCVGQSGNILAATSLAPFSWKLSALFLTVQAGPHQRVIRVGLTWTMLGHRRSFSGLLCDQAVITFGHKLFLRHPVLAELVPF